MDHLNEPVTEKVNTTTGELSHASTTVTGRSPLSPGAPEGAVSPRLHPITDWPQLVQFVDDLMHDIERGIPGLFWCPWWYRHPEAVTIFHALHHSHTNRISPAAANKASKDGIDLQASLSSWLIHELDPHLRYLLSEEGPFSVCKDDQHRYKTTEQNMPAWQTYRPTDYTNDSETKRKV